LACHRQIDSDPDPLPDPAYHFDADPDPDFYLMQIRMRIHADPDFYLMRMRIQDTKMMRIRIHKIDN
jgi:hypothetical protein